MQDKEKLVSQVLTTFFNESKFYGDNSNELVELAFKLADTNPKFISNLARYTRKEMHLRSVSHVLTCIVAKVYNSKKYILEVVNDVVERPDDLLEILSCYIQMYGKPVPNGLKIALSENLKKFNEFQISKYNVKDKKLKFKDIIKICHPKPKNEFEKKLLKDILDDKLPKVDNWRNEVTGNGQTKETWERIIEEDKIGYMAILRNLRSIVNCNPSNIQKVYDIIENKEEVLKSKQLPFRFMQAYRSVEKLDNASSRLYDVLENAIEHSIELLPRLKGKTIIAFDCSGSMGTTISLKSEVRCCDISSLLGVLASKICDDFIIYRFNGELEKINLSSKSPIIKTSLEYSSCFGGTDLGLPIKEMIDKEIYVDRLIILSDNEINCGFKYTCQSLIERYRNKVNKDLWVHAIDLQGYVKQQFNGKNVNIIAGWNEKILEFISLVEEGMENQVKKIENYE